MTSKRLSYAIAIVALLAAGFYVFVYLYRWEWNRALIAGMIFIATEIALVSALVFERIERLEKRLDERKEHHDVLQQIDEAAPEPHRPFSWLSEGRDNLNVFVPVLMGAGFVISALAWLVESLARLTAAPVLERRLAARLAPISVAGGLLTSGTNGVVAPGRPRFAGAAGKGAIAILLVVMTYAGIDLLGDLTQNRPDTLSGGSTAIVLDVETKGEMVSRREAVRSLWAACSGTTGSDLAKIGPAGSSLVLTVRPGLGKYSFRRVKGCLEDATLDGIRANVTGDR